MGSFFQSFLKTIDFGLVGVFPKLYFFQISNFVAKKLQLVFIEKVHNIFVTDNFFLYIGIRNFFAWNAIKMVFVLSYRHTSTFKKPLPKANFTNVKETWCQLGKIYFFCQLIFFNSYIIFILIKKKLHTWGPIIYFIECRSPSRHEMKFCIKRDALKKHISLKELLC